MRVEFVLAVEWAAAGGTNSLTFPDPAGVSIDLAGVRTAKLSVLIEFKLAAGTAPTRGKHTADVQEMIRVLRLPERIGAELDESVRPIYLTLWAETQNLPPEE